MILVGNPKAKYEYELHQHFLAGIVLTGQEVKSLRLKQGSLRGSFVKIVGNEALLLNAQITPYKFAQTQDYDPKRSRVLLLKKSELAELAQASQNKGWVIVPVAIKTAGKHIKVELALAKGKKAYEKRAALKERDQQRELKRQLKQRY